MQVLLLLLLLLLLIVLLELMRWRCLARRGEMVGCCGGGEQEPIDAAGVVMRGRLRLRLWGVGAGGDRGGEVRREFRSEDGGAGGGDEVFGVEGG